MRLMHELANLIGKIIHELMNLFGLLISLAVSPLLIKIIGTLATIAYAINNIPPAWVRIKGWIRGNKSSRN